MAEAAEPVEPDEHEEEDVADERRDGEEVEPSVRPGRIVRCAARRAVDGDRRSLCCSHCGGGEADQQGAPQARVRDLPAAAAVADEIPEYVLRGPRKRSAEERVPLQHLEAYPAHRCTDSCVSSTATEIALTAHQ